MARSQAVSTAQAGSSPFYAGKNKIINGDFYWNQRGFTSTTTNGGFGFDRWFLTAAGGTSTYSAETFTAGTAPVAGYEGKTFARIATTGQSATSNLTILRHRIENARTLAGQTATISFWAKASSGTPKVAVESGQYFGTGGSPSTGTDIYFGQVTLSTSWTRYSLTAAIPAITSVTFGTNNNDFLAISLWTSAGSDYNSRTGSLGLQTATIDFWGVQIEAGTAPTAFQTATGTLQGELAACQRYYFRYYPGASGKSFGVVGQVYSTTAAFCVLTFPVELRIRPTAIEQSGTAADYRLTSSNLTETVCSAVPSYDGWTSSRAAVFYGTVASGLTAGSATVFGSSNSSGYLGWSAEL